MITLKLSDVQANELISALDYIMGICDKYVHYEYGNDACVEAYYERFANIYVTIEELLWKQGK